MTITAQVLSTTAQAIQPIGEVGHWWSDLKTSDWVTIWIAVVSLLVSLAGLYASVLISKREPNERKLRLYMKLLDLSDKVNWFLRLAKEEIKTPRESHIPGGKFNSNAFHVFLWDNTVLEQYDIDKHEEIEFAYIDIKYNLGIKIRGLTKLIRRWFSQPKDRNYACMEPRKLFFLPNELKLAIQEADTLNRTINFAMRYLSKSFPWNLQFYLWRKRRHDDRRRKELWEAEQSKGLKNAI
jgi:hypothetical protein